MEATMRNSRLSRELSIRTAAKTAPVARAVGESTMVVRPAKAPTPDDIAAKQLMHGSRRRETCRCIAPGGADHPRRIINRGAPVIQKTDPGWEGESHRRTRIHDEFNPSVDLGFPRFAGRKRVTRRQLDDAVVTRAVA